MRIFISYRRKTGADIAGRIDDRLRERYGHEAVFRDVQDLPVGTEFPLALREAIDQSDVFLALIGSDWAPEPSLLARDFVRIEVETALEFGLQVIPVLVGSAPMPGETTLPQSIREIASINAEAIESGRDFDNHVERLCQSIEARQEVHTRVDEQRRKVHSARRVVEAFEQADWNLEFTVPGDRIVFLLAVQRILATTKGLFNIQTDLADDLLSGIKTTRRGKDDAIRAAAGEIPADRYWIRQRLRHETDNMRQVHGFLLRLLSRNREFQTLVPSFPALYKHLSLWVAKYEFLRYDKNMCLVFVGVEQKTRFPKRVEPEIERAIKRLDDRYGFSL